MGDAARGVAVVDPATVSDEDLADMTAAGVVGLRVNLVAGGGAESNVQFRRTAERLQGTDMFLQVYAPMARILDCAHTISEAGVPVVLDHFAGIRAGDRAEDLASLLRSAPVWIKLSADYRIRQDANTAETRALDLVRFYWPAIPDRLIWGSDWPHTGGGAAREARPTSETEPFREVYSLSVPDLLADAGLDAQARARILVRDPARPLSAQSSHSQTRETL